MKRSTRRLKVRLYHWEGGRPPILKVSNRRQFDQQRITRPRKIGRARVQARYKIGLHLWGLAFPHCPMIDRMQTNDRRMRYWFGIERLRRGVRRAARWHQCRSSAGSSCAPPRPYACRL